MTDYDKACRDDIRLLAVLSVLSIIAEIIFLFGIVL